MYTTKLGEQTNIRMRDENQQGLQKGVVVAVGSVESRLAAKAEGYDEENAGEVLIKNSDAPVSMTVKDEPCRCDRQDLKEGAVGVGSVETRDAAKAAGYDEEYACDHLVENSDAPQRGMSFKERRCSVVGKIKERRRSVIETTKAAAMGVLHEIEALRDDAVDDIKIIGNKLRWNKPEKGGIDGDDSTVSDDDLFQLISHCLFNSIMVYGLADTRELTRQGKLQLDELLVMPLVRAKIVRLCRVHLEAIKKFQGGDDLYGSAIVSLSNETCRNVMKAPPSMLLRGSMLFDAASSCSVVVFDDENSKEEIVYSIEVDIR
jgi:hypothetical protein